MTKKRSLIYLAGPYRGKNESVVFYNIMHARTYAMDIWQSGHIPVCPHLNSFLMGGIIPDWAFLAADLEVLSRCDALFLIPGWEKSPGAASEKEFAESMDPPMPVYTSMFEIEKIPWGQVPKEAGGDSPREG